MATVKLLFVGFFLLLLLLYGESVLSDIMPVFSSEQELLQESQQARNQLSYAQSSVERNQQTQYQTRVFTAPEESVTGGTTNTFLIRFLNGRITPETIVVEEGTAITLIVHNLRETPALFVLEHYDVELYLAPNQVEELTVLAEKDGIFFFDERTTPFMGYLIVQEN